MGVNMGNRAAVAGVVLVVSGALVIEAYHGGIPHGDFNVPAPTVIQGNQMQMNSTVSVATTYGPMDFQTRAQTSLILQVKG